MKKHLLFNEMSTVFLFSERRKVTVNDLHPAEIQGYLYQRLRAHQSFQWEKRWFVLSGSCLYGFKTKDSAKAACLIFLSGFTVSVANEVNCLLVFTKSYLASFLG